MTYFEQLLAVGLTFAIACVGVVIALLVLEWGLYVLDRVRR